MKVTDYIQMVKRAKNGDTSAFDELYNSCYWYVYFTCQPYFDSKEDIEEVIQDVLFKAFSNIHKLNDDVLFLAWLKKIAIRQCCNKYNQIKKDFENLENIGDLTDAEIEELNTAFLPSAYCENNELRAELFGVVNALPEVQKKMIHLYYYGELSSVEIAKLHDCTDGYVRKALFTARNTIKERLQATGTYGSFVPLGAIFLAEEAAFVEKCVTAGTYIAGTGAAIVSAIQTAGTASTVASGAGTATTVASGAGTVASGTATVASGAGTAASGAGAVASGAGVAATSGTGIGAVTGVVTAKTAVSTYAAIVAACVLTTGLIAGGVYYAILASDSEDEENLHIEIGITEPTQYENTHTDVDMQNYEHDYDYNYNYEEYEPYYYEDEILQNTSDTNQTVNGRQENVSATNSNNYALMSVYNVTPMYVCMYVEPEPIIDNTVEILSSLNTATTSAGVADIINRNGFSRLLIAQGSNGEALRFYYVNKGSGDILVGVREDEWFMKFHFFENSNINIHRSELVFWIES